MKYQRGALSPQALNPADLSIGDRSASQFDFSGMQFHRVMDADDPRLLEGYDALHAEFHPRGEMETIDIIRQRLDWRPAKPVNDLAMLYEMLVVRKGDELAAVRDHSAILNVARPDAPVIVHLSHVLVFPKWRRTGLAAWLRALPMQTARECLRGSGLSQDHPIVLASEMDHLDATDPASLKRLAAYEKAGFLKVDPARVGYLQPDFRSPAAIDASGGARPLNMNLVLRRVGRESEDRISGRELRAVVDAIYGMFATTFREKDMKSLWANLERYPSDDEIIRLLAPTK